MRRRRLLTAAVAGGLGLAGCADLTPSSSGADTNESPTQQHDNGETTTQEISLSSDHREALRDHGWSTENIDCWVEAMALVGFSQAELNQQAATKLSELNNTVATIDEMTVDFVVETTEESGNDTVQARHTFHGVTLQNTEYSPALTIPEQSHCLDETPDVTTDTPGDGSPKDVTLYLGEITPNDITSDGTVQRDIDASYLYGSGPLTVSYNTFSQSKHTTSFETTVTYPQPQISILIANANIDNPDYSDSILVELEIVAENNGQVPARTAILWDGVPLESATVLRNEETLTATLEIAVSPEEQGKTTNFVAGKMAGEKFAQTQYTLPED